ncbi:hypothetical protein MLD38_037859 [Melastoma candidum]|uniref:Uncharacterized protein n=1 Tax=Melastoma candidum TaxID=119954 RepID=A0ACB9LPL1_9MYRT|nr:hypothetical protein MLD38_037859 [Melastoma candidum]
MVSDTLGAQVELDGAELALAVAVAVAGEAHGHGAVAGEGDEAEAVGDGLLRTEDLTSISTRSMATVGTSAIMTRRRALAMLASVSRSSNLA